MDQPQKPYPGQIFDIASESPGIHAYFKAWEWGTLTWEQAINSTETLGPKTEEYTWNLKWNGPPVAKPGITRFS